MKNIFALPLGRPQSPRLNFKALTSAICSFAILAMPFAQMAAATRARSEIKYQSAKVKEGVSTNRSIATTGNALRLAPQLGSPIVSATLTDNRPGSDPAVANPGDTINYTATISNTGTADATGVQFNDDVDANTTVVSGSVKMSPLAFPDNYNGVANTQLIVAAAQGVLINDAGLPAPTATTISGGATTQGGTVTLNSDGSFTYTPPTNFAGGSDTFTYTATNGQSPNDTATVTITIPCQTITVTNPANANGTAASAFSETFTQTGAIGSATFTLASGTLPAGLTLATNGVLSGTPTQTGSFPITVTVTDSNGCTGTGATYNLTIACQTITVTNPANTNGTVGSAFSETFTQTGAIGSATFTLASGTLPAGLTLATNGVLSGTPTQNGGFPITVTVTDSNSCAGTGATYNLTIGCQTITVTNPANTNGTAGSAFSETFTQTGAIGTATFTTASTLPAGLTLATNGVLSGTPTETGSFPIVVTITDANGCTGTGATYNLMIACQTITVTNPVNTSGTASSPFSETFTQTGAMGGATFTLASGTLPAGLTLATNGVLSGTPTQTGSFPITVTVTDANGCTGISSTYTLVIGCQTITVTNPANNTGIEGDPFSETFTQTGAIDTATFTTASTLPAGLILATNGVLSGTPTETGTFPIVVTVTDANGCTGTGATYNLTINAAALALSQMASKVEAKRDGRFPSVRPNEKTEVGAQKAGARRSHHARSLKLNTRSSLPLTPAPPQSGCATTSTHVCVEVGTLQAGKSVTITFSVTVNTPYGGGSSVSNQGTVSGSNFSNVGTDDPDTGAANDATVTPICGANLVVTNTNDSGSGSLRQTILNLCPGGTITFDPALTSGGPATITLLSELVIDRTVTINGSTNNGLTLSGNNASRIFNINSGVSLSISTLTIANGRAATGGGILNAGTLTIINSTINNNVTTAGADATGATNGGNGGNGGGIFNTGTVTLINSTVGGNQTGRGGDNFSGATGNGGNSGSGAGIYSTGTVQLTNTTITDNESGRIGFVATTDPAPPGVPGVVGTGVGVFNSGGTLTLNNTIVANNLDGFGTEDDVNGDVNPSSGFNFIGTNTGLTGISHGSNGNQIGTADSVLTPLLGALADNGGPTRTYLPQAGSPVIDAGSNALAKDQSNNDLTTDQRGAGFPRVVNGTVEIGAVESTETPAPAGADMIVSKTADVEQVVPDRDITYTITVRNVGADPATNATMSDPLPIVPTSSSPTSMTFVSLAVAPGWVCTTPAVGSGGTISCTRASVAGSSVHTFTLVAHVPSAAEPNPDDPFITNGVTVSAENDPNTENDTGAVSTLLVSCINNPVVTTSADSGAGSLRQAIADACAGSTITFNLTPGNVVSPITLTTAELLVDKNLTIQGPAVDTLTVIRSTAVGTPNFHIFRITSGNTVTISGLTLTNGVGTAGLATNGGGILNEGVLTIRNSVLAGNTAENGGGILNQGGTLTVISSTVSNNHADTGSGGGILSSGPLTIINSTVNGNTAFRTGGIEVGAGTAEITNSTISGNSAIGDGGGLQTLGGTATLTNVTVTNNRSNSDNDGDESGGGLRNGGGTITLRNTIVAANYRGSGTSTPDDIAETVDVPSSSFNLIGTGGTGGLANNNGNQVGVNPLLGVLANNGGPTDTHLLLPGSSAINAGSNALLPVDAFDLNGNADTGETLPVDQRGTGFPRVVNTTVDIGAVEVNYSVTATAGTPQSATVNTAFAAALQATVTESGTAQNGLSVTFTAPASGASGTFPGPSTTAVVLTNSSGVATAPTFTANAIGGTYNVVASIGAGQPTATFTLTNTKLNQTITFGALADKTFGDPDFTVSANATSGLTVTFAASGNCTVSGNTVHLTGAGSCTITASQAGDDTYNAATSVAQSFNIAKAASSTTVTSSLNPSNVGQSVTFTATVSSVAGTPTGTVQFKDGGANIGPAQALDGSGVATFSTSSLTAGIHAITDDYSGDANFLVSTGTLSGGQQVGSIIRFSSATYNTTEGSGFTTITVQRIGDLSQAVSVDYTTPDDSSSMTVLPCSTANGVASPRCDFTTALGTLQFAAGDGASKTFIVLVNQDNFVEGPETLSLTLSNLTGGAGFSVPGATTSTATLTIADDVTEPASNPIDDTDTFVRQHYHDFLNRDADAAGLAFWTDNIDKCNDPARRPPGLTAPQCIEIFRVHTSAAFYLSIEFQQSGYYVYRMFKAGFDDIAPPTVPVPVRYSQFIRDAAEVNRGVIVGQGAWEAQLDQNKQAFALAFVQRPEFLSRYPASTSAEAFVDTLNANAGGVLTSSERSALVSELSPDPTDPVLRASVLRKVADNAVLMQQQFNRAFVLMQYFGYLRRNPDAAPEPGLNFDGFNFWLNKLNSFNGDFIKSEMVKAFISSAEYRQRFGQ